MSDDLRAAAERTVAWYEGMARHGGGWDELADGIVSVARAYLAEHPADDGEPADFGWLRSIGFATSGEGCAGAATLGPVEAFGVLPGPLRWRFGGLEVGENLTRGDVRRLLAALGVTTTEG